MTELNSGAIHGLQLPLPVSQGGTGTLTSSANHIIYVDGDRTDTYTADGTKDRPYKTILLATTAINTDAAVHAAAGHYELTNYSVEIAPGTYTGNLALTNYKCLRFIAPAGGVFITGTITSTQTQQSGDYYSRLEFIGCSGTRAEKGPALKIAGNFTATRNNDSLTYIVFDGCWITGNQLYDTDGTFVVSFRNSRIAGTIDTGTFTDADSAVLIETTGWTEFAGAITDKVSFYNVDNAEFYGAISITPIFDCRITNSRFGSTISIVASKNLYVDTVSLKAIVDRTPTLTGMTIVYLDQVANGTYKGIIDIAAPGAIGGTTPNQAIFTNEYLSSSEIDHGMTSLMDTNQYAAIYKIVSASGGLDVWGLTDADQDGAVRISGIIGTDNPTDTNSALILRGGKKNGTGWQALAAAETVLSIYNYTTLLATLYGNGELILSSLQNTPIGSSIASTGKFTTAEFSTSYKLLGSSGGFTSLLAEATSGALTGATGTITLNIPTGSYIRGVQLRVDTLIETATAWTAAFSGGNTATICTGQDVAQNTKVNSFSGGLTTNTTQITLTAEGGNFSAGNVRAIVYYDTFTAMSSL